MKSETKSNNQSGLVRYVDNGKQARPSCAYGVFIDCACWGGKDRE